MQWQIWVPLAAASCIYIVQAVAYVWVQGRYGLAACFVGYTMANLGLIYDAWQWSGR